MDSRVRLRRVREGRYVYESCNAGGVYLIRGMAYVFNLYIKEGREALLDSWVGVDFV